MSYVGIVTGESEAGAPRLTRGCGTGQLRRDTWRELGGAARFGEGPWVFQSQRARGGDVTARLAVS